MTRCDRALGRRLLEGDLAPDEETSILSHLDHCQQCQWWLEQDAGGEAAWTSTRRLLHSSGEVVHFPSTAPASASWTQPLVRGAAAHRGPGRDHVHVDLSFLAPSDDPAYVGRIGSYEIVGVIGQGGMGVVLKAADRTLNRYVAIKVLSPQLAGVAAARQRFAREARAMAALPHEHVVPIYAVDEHQGLPYFAMEYVAGGTLQTRLSLEGPLDAVSTVRIAMQTARGLAAAHDSGLVHRDIKPANILLDRGVERVRVADFGLARVASEASCTASGMLAGTPQFMAPEQVRGEACDGRSDLFSLGSVMYAMSTGHEPFRADSVYGILQRIVNDEPRSIREQNPSTPRWLEAFIAKLMAKDAESRFASAAEVAELLEHELAYLQNAALDPPARSWLRRRSGFKKSRRWLRPAALGEATVAAILVAVALWRPWTDDPRLPPATAPLWDADELANVVQFAEALEAGALDLPVAASPDPWVADYHELRQRLGELSEESPFPFSPRSQR
jgi:serine/threonine-protein kinase